MFQGQDLSVITADKLRAFSYTVGKGLSANLSSSCSCSHPVSLSPATELAKGKQNGWFKKKKKKSI